MIFSAVKTYAHHKSEGVIQKALFGRCYQKMSIYNHCAPSIAILLEKCLFRSLVNMRRILKGG